MIRSKFRKRASASGIGCWAMLAASPASADGGSAEAAEVEAQAKAEIIVTASLDKPLVTTLGDLEVKDTPLSIATYDRALLDTVQARNISTVVRFDPAVTSQPTSGGFGAAVSIRGFDVGSVFDGLPTPAVDLYRANTALFATERVTMLRGVSSLLYAGSSFTPIGGVINIEPKRPLDTPLTRVTAGFADRALGLLAIDASRRFGADERIGLRINLGTERGHGPIDLQDEIDNTVLAAALDVRLTPELTLSGGGQYSRASVNAYRDNVVVAPGIAVPEAPPARRNMMQPWGLYPAETICGRPRRCKSKVGCWR